MVVQALHDSKQLAGMAPRIANMLKKLIQHQFLSESEPESQQKMR